jgi:hypothetical protein
MIIKSKTWIKAKTVLEKDSIKYNNSNTENIIKIMTQLFQINEIYAHRNVIVFRSKL